MSQSTLTSKSNQSKLASQERMRRGETLGHIDPAWARRRYIDDAVEISVLADEMGISVIYARRFLQAHGIERDQGFIYRAGTKPKERKGVRVPGSRRDPSTKARAGSPEHREKQAAAKRGKTGPASNRWKGGHEIGGYVGVGGGSSKGYEHRVIAERILGRELKSHEQVHHVDRDRKNNDPTNLLVLNADEHARLHKAMRRQLDLDQRAWLAFEMVPFFDLGLLQTLCATDTDHA